MKRLIWKTPVVGRLAVMGVLLLAVVMPARAGLAIQQWTQSGGARVYLIESPSIPMVDVQIDFDAGGRRDPAAQAGLASATAGMSSRGVRAGAGEPALDEDALDEAWTDLGASFSAGAGRDAMSFSLRSLTRADLLERAARLAARQMGEPRFDAAIWQRERERSVAALREAETRPASVAARAYARAVFGAHPYGQQTTPETLARIGVDDMRALHASRIRACRAVISIVGAVDRAQATRLVTTLLSRLPPGPCRTADDVPVPDVSPLAGPQELRIPFASAQAHVYVGQPGYARQDPDHFALTVGNYILGGGGFVSRLSEEVRQKRGLSYSVYSSFSPGRHAGAFTVGLQTRPDQADQAVAVVREVLRRFVAEGPTEAELRAAKDGLINGYPLLLDSNRKLLGNLSNIAWNQLPLDYLDTWTDRVQAVSAAQVREAMARKLRPEAMVTVVLGGRP